MNILQNNLLQFPAIENLASRVKGKRVVLVGPCPLANQAQKIDSYDIVARIKRGFPIANDIKADVGTRTDLLYTNLRDSQNWVRPKHIAYAGRQNPPVAYCYPYPSDPPKKLRALKLDENYYHNYRLFMTQPVSGGGVGVGVGGEGGGRGGGRDGEGRAEFYHCFSSKRYHDLEYREVGTRPTTGLLAIIHLLSLEPAELYLTGFTFRVGAEKTFQNNLYHPSYKTEVEALESWNRTVKTPVHKIEREVNYMRRLLLSDHRIILDDRLYGIFFRNVNFVMSRINAISSFYPFIEKILGFREKMERRGIEIKINLFLHANPKQDFDPFRVEYLQYLQDRMLPQKINIYHSHYLDQYPGLVFVVEGDMVGWKRWEDSSAQYWSKRRWPWNKHYIVSFINCWDFYKNLGRYRKHVDCVAIPEFYRDYYSLEYGPQLIPYGNPKFDYSFKDWDRDEIMKKYGVLAGGRKIALLLYPKKRDWLEAVPHDLLARIIRYTRDQGYYVIVKARAQDGIDPLFYRGLEKGLYGYLKPDISSRLRDREEGGEDDDYLGDLIVPRDYDWIPPTTFELLKVSSLMIQFSSASVEESVYVGCPVVDFKIDREHDRFRFLLTPDWISRISLLPPVDWKEAKRKLKRALLKDYNLETFNSRWDQVDRLGLPRSQISDSLVTRFLDRNF